MEQPTLEDRFLGCIFGLAIGDALGYPVEFMSKRSINHILGPNGVTGFDSLEQPGIRENIAQPIGAYSDDTQMSLATANGIINSKSDSINEIMDSIAKEYIAWADSPENNRAPGNTCMAGIRNLKKGIHWEKSGIPGGKGCGAAMRTAPIGLYFTSQIRETVGLAKAASQCTHYDLTAIASGIATALTTTLLANGEKPEYIAPASDSHFYPHATEEFKEKIKLMRLALPLEPGIALPVLGQGWKGDEALAMGLYCFLKNPTDYRKTVLNGVNIDGDSDSVASIAGAFSGTYNGIQAIPAEWIARIENKSLLEKTAKALYQKAINKKA